MNEARDSSYYSDILESIVDLIHKEGGGIQALLYEVHAKDHLQGGQECNRPDQRHLTKNFMNKFKIFTVLLLNKCRLDSPSSKFGLAIYLTIASTEFDCKN